IENSRDSQTERYDSSEHRSDRLHFPSVTRLLKMESGFSFSSNVEGILVQGVDEFTSHDMPNVF
ncbi:hypothetical protein J6590_099339, partial [Homalodisca vitripennis]